MTCVGGQVVFKRRACVVVPAPRITIRKVAVPARVFDGAVGGGRGGVRRGQLEPRLPVRLHVQPRVRVLIELRSDENVHEAGEEQPDPDETQSDGVHVDSVAATMKRQGMNNKVEYDSPNQIYILRVRSLPAESQGQREFH